MMSFQARVGLNGLGVEEKERKRYGNMLISMSIDYELFGC
jgi:hypothetical protein